MDTLVNVGSLTPTNIFKLNPLCVNALSFQQITSQLFDWETLLSSACWAHWGKLSVKPPPSEPQVPPPVSRPSWSHTVTRSSRRPLWPSSEPRCWRWGWRGRQPPPLSPSWTPGRWRSCSCMEGRGRRWRATGRSCWLLRGGSGRLPGSAGCRVGCWRRGPLKSRGWASGTGRGFLGAPGWAWREGRWRRPGHQDTEHPPATLTLEPSAPMSLSEAGRQDRRGSITHTCPPLTEGSTRVLFTSEHVMSFLSSDFLHLHLFPQNA